MIYLMKGFHNKKKVLIILLAAIITAGVFFWFAKNTELRLMGRYAQGLSASVTDRNGKTIFLRPNDNGYYAPYLDSLPDNIKKLLVAKEDRFFYWHFGINPVSVAKNALSDLGFGQRQGSSTISQQLAKLLLGQENRRNLQNKIKETAAAVLLETFQSKEKIITEYANLIYFGNRLQGILAASLAYFGTTPDKLSSARVFQLLAAVSNPNSANPAKARNIEQAKLLAKNLKMEIGDDFIEPKVASDNLKNYYALNQSVFELENYLSQASCSKNQQTALDYDLNGKLRQVIADNIKKLDTNKAKNAAAIIIKLPENEILALAGSPDPSSDKDGYRINMLNTSRQVGSTIKPFIYLKAFEKGMRPYTLIDDREYKYPAAEGFSIYPENYDRSYHGIMTAHYALANSINVAAVLTLEFVGTDEFGEFVQQTLDIPVGQDYENYQMGVALGALETNLIDLAQAFTALPNSGNLRNLTLFSNQPCNTVFKPQKAIQISTAPYAQMINKILSDRAIAQDQFTSASNLNLPQTNYALKTGTSHDYTDSWVIGYTPDYLAAVWVGNADGSAMDGISGQMGAGRIWSDIMQIMLDSNYNKKTPFDFSQVIEYKNGANLQFGLKSDDYERSKNILLDRADKLILKPYDGDIYKLEKDTRIILRSSTIADWQVNGASIGSGTEMVWIPDATGIYTIGAKNSGNEEQITIEIKR